MPPARRSSVAERLPRLAAVRAKVIALAKRYAGRGVTLVDLYTPTAWRPDVFNPDRVHLNAAGYRLLAEILYPVV